jgi:hypothetical protein
MCIRRETREKARRSLAFSRVSKPHTHITHMLRQCTSIVYLYIPSQRPYLLSPVEILTSARWSIPMPPFANSFSSINYN